MDDPAEIMQNNGTKIDRFNEASTPIYDGYISYPDLVFQDNEKS